MLEILALIAMGKRIGSKMRDKGRSAGWHQFLLVVLWFGGELVGAVFGVLATHGRGGVEVYVFALIGAAIGAGVTFLIVNSAAPNSALYQQTSPISNYPPPVTPAFYQQQPAQPSNYQPSFNSAMYANNPGAAPSTSAEQRLSRLNELRSKNLISEYEFQERRQQILKDL